MQSIADEVRAAIGTRRSAAHPARVDGAEIRERLAKRYAPELRSGEPLWERLEDSTSVRHSEGWRRIAEFVTGRAFLAFEPRVERAAFEFERGSDIVDVLEQCSGFEFYVTDDTASYVLCFNDHDHLIAAGSARAWLLDAFR